MQGKNKNLRCLTLIRNFSGCRLRGFAQDGSAGVLRPSGTGEGRRRSIIRPGFPVEGFKSVAGCFNAVFPGDAAGGGFSIESEAWFGQHGVQ